MDYAKLAEEAAIKETAEALGKRNIEAHIVETKEEALALIKQLIPAGASVMNGSSRTLDEIGYLAYLKGGEHGWNDLHAAISAEKDPAKQAELRKQALMSEYYLGSLHALAQTGEFVVASGSGSQLPHIVFTSKNIILVAGIQKIVPTLVDAFARIEEYVFPLEDARMKSTGAAGSVIAKELVFRREPDFMGRKFRIILVKEKLGF